MVNIRAVPPASSTVESMPSCSGPTVPMMLTPAGTTSGNTSPAAAS